MAFGTVEELRDLLDEMVECGLGELPIRMAHQQNWPLAEVIATATRCESSDGADTIWLACNPAPRHENPYAPREAWEGEW